MIPIRRAKGYLPALLIAWILFVFWHDRSHPAPTLFSGGEERVLLLTAHPDDECMFFAPTILSLLQSSTPLFSLCLSVGNAEGLGNARVQELRKSLQILGIPHERSRVIDHPLLQDNFTTQWKPEVVAEAVRPYIDAHNITVVLTFDELGISQHPNHISLPNGVAHLLTSSSPPSARLFTLKTVPLPFKYMGLLSHPLTKLRLWLPWMSTNHQTHVAGFGGYQAALRAMYQHQSQLVWFRWLYVLFSRYMWVNEWNQMRIPGAQ